MDALISRFCLFIALMFGMPDVLPNVGADCHVPDELGKAEYVDAQHDERQKDALTEDAQPLSGTLLSTKTSQRVGHSRPARPHLTGGGKNNRIACYGVAHSISCLSYLPDLSLQPLRLGICGGSASPRFYYIIALRRILC